MAYANGLDLSRTAIEDIPEFSPVTLVEGEKRVKITPKGEAADGFALDAVKANRPVRVRVNSESNAYVTEAVTGGTKLASNGDGKLKPAEEDEVVIAKAVEDIQSFGSVQLKGTN